MKELLQMKPEDQKIVFEAIIDRYKYDQINKKILEELEWLKSFQNLLLKEIESRTDKLSGYRLKEFKERYLNEAIQKLEATQK